VKRETRRRRTRREKEEEHEEDEVGRKKEEEEEGTCQQVGSCDHHLFGPGRIKRTREGGRTISKWKERRRWITVSER